MRKIKINPSDFLKGTSHLTYEEKGFFIFILMNILNDMPMFTDHVKFISPDGEVNEKIKAFFIVDEDQNWHIRY